MSEKKDLGTIYDNLEEIRAKMVFLNTANKSVGEKVQEGDFDLFADDVRGNYLIGLDLEVDFKNNLSDLAKLTYKD